MATIATFAAFSSRAFNTAFNKILPTGGNYVIDNNGAGKRVHVFTSPGYFSIPSGIPLTGKHMNLEVLVVGAGGNAGGGTGDDGSGGGGGGGAVVYDSSLSFQIGGSFYVGVGGGGSDFSYIDAGIYSAMSGGDGGTYYDYSKGWPGGSGGGGSWQNGAPNGSIYSLASPGVTWGNTGPSSPTNTQYSPIISLTPSQSNSNVANIVSKTWNQGYHHNRGNGQYKCTSEVPSSTKGVANTSPFSPAGFRARGGGGASYTGGLGGQGLKTDFINAENGTWDWICGGGPGRPATDYNAQRNSYWPPEQYTGTIWCDTGVSGGIWYDTAFREGNQTGQWITNADNIRDQAIQHHPAGSDENYGAGGGYHNYWGERQPGNGKVIIRYDLTSFPGGAPSAYANVFGGNIFNSANGKYRYHTWDVDIYAAQSGAASNSQSWFIPGYRPQIFDIYLNYYPIDQVSPGANTEPFYYYADVPAFPYDYFLIGGGGAYGYKPGGYTSFYPGGGGAGGIRYATESSTSVAISTWNMPTLDTALTWPANYASVITGSFAYRPGFVETYPNSTKHNSWIDPSNLILSPQPSTANVSLQRSGTIRIKGWSNDGGGQSAYSIVNDNPFNSYITCGYWNSATNGADGPDGDKAYLYMDPQNSQGSGPYWSLGEYDGYFYNNYTRVRIGPLMATNYGPGEKSSGASGPAWVAYTDGSLLSFANTTTTLGVVPIDRSFTLGTDTGPFTAVATGTHPQTGESYYNRLRVNSGITKYSNAATHLANSWGIFWGRITAQGLHVANNSVDRNLYFQISPYFGNRQLHAQCVIQNGTNARTREFRYVEGPSNTDYVDIFLPAGWRFENTYGEGTSMATAHSYDNPDTFETKVFVYKRPLRKIMARHLFANDIQIGRGGSQDASADPYNGAGSLYRNGAPTSIHKQNENAPPAARIAYGGGAGGYYFDYSSLLGPAKYRGTGGSTYGGGGGPGWLGFNQTEQANTQIASTGSTNCDGSPATPAYVGGGSGGGSINTKSLGPLGSELLLLGSTRGSTGVSQFSTGRHSKMDTSRTDIGHGGRGYFGGTSTWSLDPQQVYHSPSGSTYDYYVSINQFPHNAQFSAGGGGGAGGSGTDASLSTGGNGGAGVAYSMTGYSTIYGAGGGGFGRKINGVPGSSMPADPSTVSVPAGAPDGPAYLPYGIGGGWSPGRQEGGGADGGATKYYPGSGPWPVAYDVSAGQEHMDAMRYWNVPVPSPQVGNIGSNYNGRQGVVLISYDRAPFYA